MDVLTELRLHVLLAVGHGTAHGYLIGKRIGERSRGRLDPSTGALYQALKHLVSDGLLRPVPPPEGDEVDSRRKYFALTPAGRQAIAAEVGRLEGLVALAREQHLYPANAQ